MVPGEKRSSKSLLHSSLIAVVLFLVSSLPASGAQGKGDQEGWRAGKIIDEAVKNVRGEELGEVDDLIIDRKGKVEQIILSVGGFLGLDEKLVVMPFKPLKITDLGIVYNVSKQELKDRPAFRYGGK